MTALTEDRNTVWSQGVEESYSVATAVTIYGGSLVCLNAAGYAVPGADTVGFVFVGVAIEQVVNAGANGAEIVVVRRPAIHDFVAAGMALTDIGALAHVVDDQTVGLAATTTNDIVCGRIARFNSATNVGVDTGRRS